MKVETTPIAGVKILTPACFRDERGFFLESFQSRRYSEAGIGDIFVQDNHSRSSGGVLRGLHYQVRRPQAQLVTILSGRIFDVTVDLRRGSPGFGRWFGIELSDAEPKQIYMPPGIAHGFCVLSASADVHYKVTRPYDAGDDAGIVWNDPDIGVRWPADRFTIGARDAAFPMLRDVPPHRLPQTEPMDRKTSAETEKHS